MIKISTLREAFMFQSVVASFLRENAPADNVAAQRAGQLEEYLDACDDGDESRMPPVVKSLHDAA